VVKALGRCCCCPSSIVVVSPLAPLSSEQVFDSEEEAGRRGKGEIVH
jgi:hypothetical protein